MRKLLDYTAFPALVLLCWTIAAQSGRISPVLLPSPAAVARAFKELLLCGDLFVHVAASAWRTLAGFFLALFSGTVLALVTYGDRAAQRRTFLLVEALRVTPPLSLIPLLILWLGIDEAPKIAIVFLSSFFPIYLNTSTALAGVSPKLIEVARLLHFTSRELFFKLRLPAALPGLLTGIRLGFGYSWRALVGAELVAASSGLGFLISESAEFAKTDMVFVGILTIALLGVAADALLRVLVARLLPEGALAPTVS